MPDPMFSPDGKWMWSGTEWIPAPPSNSENTSDGSQTVNVQDAVIGRDVVHNTVINNDATVVTSAVVAALQQLGVINQQTVETTIPPIPEVVLPPSFSIGDHVEYHSPTNARWLDRCRVVNVNDDGTYRVEVPKDGDVVETKHAVVIGVSPGTIRPASSPYNSGDRVFVNWKNYGHYYPGTIASENTDHTFLIHFDDGDVENNVEWSRIEILQEESPEVKEYVDAVKETHQEFNELIEAFKVFDQEGKGTISAIEYFKILTEVGEQPLEIEEVMESFSELGIGMDSEIDYYELARHLVGGDTTPHEPVKPNVIIRDASIDESSYSKPILRGYAYAHPKLGEGPVETSEILGISYDERATANVETKNTIYTVGPTGWKERPKNHPFNNTYSTGEQINVEWKGSWWEGLIREISADKYLIHYVGFDSSWDEWVTTERIQKKS